MALFNLNINGKSREVDVDPGTPLLWVLRDHLGLKGTKYGCGVAMCGSCTVHLNGIAMRSCTLSISMVGNQKITTIEGLSENVQKITTIEGLSENVDHPVQKAWLELDVPQCGYCQSGQIMSAAALLNANPNPSDAEIEGAMDGNICRCGTYVRIKAAIKEAAKSTNS
jgi:aerobic-type carbon monoxide dehydrogenase small subunit (CoxS/CutS family)